MAAAEMNPRTTRPADEGPTASALASARTGAYEPLVLVIDDDGMMRMLVRESLESGGFRVEEAEEGESGLVLFESLRPDVVLLDVVMPGMDGFSTCAALRGLPAGARVPVLMMTGLDDTVSVNRAYECGATDFVAKPIAWPILSHRVRYLLRASQSFEALARSQEQLAEAQRMAQLGYWEWDVKRNAFHQSDELLRIFGVHRASFPNHLGACLPLVHPEDVSRFKDALNIPPEPGKSVHLEHRIIRPDGVTRILNVQAKSIHDAAGNLLRIQGTTQDITERRQAEERMRTLTLYDALTGLPNRQFFKEQLDHSLALAQRLKLSLAVLVLDIDRFQRINETFGHGVGDQLLKKAGTRLTRILRDADYVARVETSAETHNVARLGGDEFTIMLTGLTQAEDVAKVARRLLDETARPLQLDGQEVVVTASIGIAVFPTDGTDTDTLLKNADSAMYFAKKQGKNNYQFFSASTNARSFQKLGLENGLRKALEREELVLHYQPKVDAAGGVIFGVEALVRWKHPDLGMVPPGDFIPLAEETGLILPIGEWVLGEACRQLSAWRAAGFADLTMAVNMASQNFAQKGFVKRVTACILSAGLVPEGVEIEVTESVLMQDVEATIATLRALKENGIALSVDDFGTGYSSLAYLKRFPIDTLKIDRSFVRDVMSNREDAAITSAIITLAKRLDMQVVAEGVETAEQAAFLRREGCHLMQGYFFGRPLAAVDLTPLLGVSRAVPVVPHAGTAVKYKSADQRMPVFARA
jgi:diguanylate cyclase (GGDEF)-like protein/PAS domain S-box-containing protein